MTPEHNSGMMFIRQMMFADVDRVYGITRMSLEEEYLREVFYFFITNWPSGQLVAVDTIGNIVGFLSSAKLSSDKVTISLFAVDPRYRRKGAGSRLMDEFAMKASMDGRHYIQLEVRESDAGAISFYRAMGFTAVEYLAGFYNNGGSAVRMMRNVRGNS